MMTIHLPHLEELARTWRLEGARYERFAPGAAAAFETCAAELTELVVAASEEIVTLQEAAKRTGYSYDHLRRLVRTGKIVPVRPGSPVWVRVADLPKKGGSK